MKNILKVHLLAQTSVKHFLVFHVVCFSVTIYAVIEAKKLNFVHVSFCLNKIQLRFDRILIYIKC